MKTVGLYTLGCKVAQYETCAIAESFADFGYTVVDFSAPADVYIINTCTVTAESDAKSRKMIRRARKNNPAAKIIVCGCYSQRSASEVFSLPEVDAVIGSYGKMSLTSIAERLFTEGGRICEVSDINEAPFEKMKIKSFERTRAYLKIEDGCECKCTYCAIPSARGRVRSKPMQDIIDEVKALSGVCSEVVLTGIEAGSWGVDFGIKNGLAELLMKIDAECQGVRIRLGSLAPELVGEEFAEKIRGLKCLAPHFHISVQSGSDAVLRRMKRRYTRARALENIERLRRLIPEATFTTDLMVGFPGESEEDFLETVSFLREARLLSAHVFAYSRRHGTEAAEYPDQVMEDIKRERSARLIAVAREVGRSVIEGRFGKECDFVIETEVPDGWLGHSDSFIELKVLDAARSFSKGDVIRVIPKEIKDDVVIADICKQ